ncbi:MAG: ThiF family adenylyltransferase [Planctomycetaceae bacterium]|nr:ThiF family adenylyltransferase [Planctomycetaceae bacterium]
MDLSRYRKQTLFAGIGDAGQERICAGRVLVVGCGALGSVIAESLVRAGVGFIRIADRDFVELSNLQRQVLYDEDDVARQWPKAIAAARKLERINSTVQIEPHVADVAAANILDFARDVDVIVDGTDNFEVRFLINDASLETRTPWINGGVIGSHGQVMTIIPGRTPCLRCLMADVPEPGATETCDTAGVIGAAVNVVASLQAVETLQQLVSPDRELEPTLTVVDVWHGTWRRLKLGHDLPEKTNCPACIRGERLWLTGERGARSTVLCGRNAVQVSPQQPGTLSLEELELRLSASGTVSRNPFLLRLVPAGTDFELTLFRDGRAIIRGTEDIATARSLYARYIGS